MSIHKKAQQQRLKWRDNTGESHMQAIKIAAAAIKYGISAFIALVATFHIYTNPQADAPRVIGSALSCLLMIAVLFHFMSKAIRKHEQAEADSEQRQ